MLERGTLVIIFGLLAIFCSVQTNAWQTNVRRRNLTCWILFLFIVIQNGSRDYLFSTNDTYNYYQGYLTQLSVPLDEVIGSMSLVAGDYESRDPGFYIFQKITQLIWPDFRFLLVIVACIIGYPLTRILYRYSTTMAGIFIGMALYEALFAGFFDTGMRQTVAMGLVFMALLLQQSGRSWKIWGIFLFLAYTMHTSSLIFLPIFILQRFKNQNRLLALSLVAAPGFMVFAKPIIVTIGGGTIFESYAVDSDDNLGTPVFTALVFLAVLAAKIKAETIQRIYPHYQVLFSAMVMALMLTPASWVDSNFIRLTFYYLIFLMPLLSVVIDAVFRKSASGRSLAYTLLAVALIVLTNR